MDRREFPNKKAIERFKSSQRDTSAKLYRGRGSKGARVYCRLKTEVKGENLYCLTKEMLLSNFRKYSFNKVRLVYLHKRSG